jgi:hypothetical protein
MNMLDMERFLQLRDELFVAIGHELSIDSHCKTYEGSMSIVWPCYFEDGFVIKLDCYVVGPSRHYDWSGETFEEALDKAEKDIREWIKESLEDD